MEGSSSIICQCIELEKHIGCKIFLKTLNKHLFMGILVNFEKKKNRYKVNEITLKFKDKREYITTDLDAEYLVVDSHNGEKLE
jgi:hypothetical protein